MERLTIPDVIIDKNTIRRTIIDASEVKKNAMEFYWRLKVIEDIISDTESEEYGLDRLRELAQADREGRCVVLGMPRKPLVWGDDEQNTCLCPCCGKDLMGIPYGERMVLQCPGCGQYLDATKVISNEAAEAALRREQDE